MNAGGAVTDNGTKTLTGTTSITASGQDVTLDDVSNDFADIGLTANNVTLVDASGVALNASTLGGDLTVTAGGTVTDNGALDIGSGTTSLTLSSGDVTLDDNNDFGTITTTGAGAITVNDINNVILGNNTATSLTVTATNGVTDSGSQMIAGATSITATDSVVLDDASNNFSTITVSGSDATLVDVDAITIDSASTTVGDLIPRQVLLILMSVAGVLNVTAGRLRT